MLYSLQRPRTNSIDAIEKQIEFHWGEITKLRFALNSRVPIFGLPAELLSKAFLYVVESSIECDGWRFNPRAFNFRRVCRRWNEVAISFPRLWVWWLPGIINSWHLLKARSRDAPISVTWRPAHPPPPLFRDIFEDPALPARVRQLDFYGTSEELEYLLGTFDLAPLSNVSSIRIHAMLSCDPENSFTRFLHYPLPKLSKLDIKDVQPDCLSPVFTTSNLTSLKLHFDYNAGRRRYTLTQFSQILQRHPNLRELDLTDGAIPRGDSSEDPVPVVLPQLVDLKLCGRMAECILGLINVIGMPPLLRNVGLQFSLPHGPDFPVFINAVNKILTTYYECEAPEYPRKVNRLTISSRRKGLFDNLCFVTRPRPIPTSNPQSIFRLEFDRTPGRLFDLFPLLPLSDVQEVTIDGLKLSSAAVMVEYVFNKRVIRALSPPAGSRPPPEYD